MRWRYVFSALAVIATVALFWKPKPAQPVDVTRDEDGVTVTITTNPEPHRFDEYLVSSIETDRTDVFALPRSYIRSRLCSGDPTMLAAIQARLVLTNGQGEPYGALVDDCDFDGGFCAAVAGKLTGDAGLSVDELLFFSAGIERCRPDHFASLREAMWLPLEVRERAWSGLEDAGLWSPGLSALVDEHFTSPPPGYELMSILNEVKEESPELLAATRLLMESDRVARQFLRQSPVSAVRAQACALMGCDAGLISATPEEREDLAACALQNDVFGQCLDRLAELDWAMARSVSLRSNSEAMWAPALRAFETHDDFVRFANEVNAEPRDDGGFTPSLLEFDDENMLMREAESDDGLGTDELAMSWSSLSPELRGAFFAETGEEDGGVLLSGWNRDERFRVGVRRGLELRDSRAVLALLNAMAAQSRTSKRFFLIKSPWSALIHFEEPTFMAKLLERKLIVLEELE